MCGHRRRRSYRGSTQGTAKAKANVLMKEGVRATVGEDVAVYPPYVAGVYENRMNTI